MGSYNEVELARARDDTLDSPLTMALEAGGSAGDFVRRHQSREEVDRLVSPCT